MRRLASIPLALAFAVSGCQGCSFPFETSSNGVIRLSLHAPGPDCVDEGSEVLDNGTPDDPSDDSTISWSHNAAANTCALSSTWQGTLLGMAGIREDVDAAIADAGLEGQSASVELTSITPTIESVTMVDDVEGDNDPDVTGILQDVVQRYAGCVALGDGSCDANDAASGMFTVTTEGGTLAAPVTAVNDPEGLVAAANAAIAGEENVTGTGAALTEAALVDDGSGAFVVPPALQGLNDPTLVITVRFDVEGQVSLAP
jgi:hypothetical protein